MFIIVKYGQNESLLVNPSCAVVNLLTSIKRRTGYGNSNIILDLSDETGLVKELDVHKNEYAASYLTSHCTYILVQKDPLMDDAVSSIADSRSTPAPPPFSYRPLLEGSTELFPNFRLHVAEVERKKTRGGKGGSKSPSPAGRLVSKPKKTPAKQGNVRRK